ncbi:MAG TPA: cyclic nucleotide-binding domain-containing protein [Thermoplasmata archaeon]|nr:cyclic nucleotide-binding domain-containing protein [Thermoplasmata archaeon]
MMAPAAPPGGSPLGEHPFLRGLDPEFLRALQPLARSREFATGDHLVREGDVAESLHLILAGKVALELVNAERPRLTVQTLGPGEVLGWSWLVPPHRWRFDARALKPTRTWAIEAAGLRALLEARPEQGYRFLLRLLPVVAERLEHTRIQLMDIYAP